MKKAIIGLGAAVVMAVPAQAHHPNEHQAKAKPANCTPFAVGYHARGKLVEATLTQTAGQDTAKRGDDRYDGTVKVDVKRANHRAPKGEQTFTLENARVRFYDANRDRKADEPKAGDRVALHGKITKLRQGCDSTGFTPVITVRHVRFRPAKAN